MSDFLTRVYPEDGSAAFGKSPLYNFDLFQNLVASSKSVGEFGQAELIYAVADHALGLLKSSLTPSTGGDDEKKKTQDREKDFCSGKGPLTSDLVAKFIEYYGDDVKAAFQSAGVADASSGLTATTLLLGTDLDGAGGNASFVDKINALAKSECCLHRLIEGYARTGDLSFLIALLAVISLGPREAACIDDNVTQEEETISFDHGEAINSEPSRKGSPITGLSYDFVKSALKFRAPTLELIDSVVSFQKSDLITRQFCHDPYVLVYSGSPSSLSRNSIQGPCSAAVLSPWVAAGRNGGHVTYFEVEISGGSEAELENLRVGFRTEIFQHCSTSTDDSEVSNMPSRGDRKSELYLPGSDAASWVLDGYLQALFHDSISAAKVYAEASNGGSLSSAEPPAVTPTPPPAPHDDGCAGEGVEVGAKSLLDLPEGDDEGEDSEFSLFGDIFDSNEGSNSSSTSSAVDLSAETAKKSAEIAALGGRFIPKLSYTWKTKTRIGCLWNSSAHKITFFINQKEVAAFENVLSEDNGNAKLLPCISLGHANAKVTLFFTPDDGFNHKPFSTLLAPVSHKTVPHTPCLRFKNSLTDASFINVEGWDYGNICDSDGSFSLHCKVRLLQKLEPEDEFVMYTIMSFSDAKHHGDIGLYLTDDGTLVLNSRSVGSFEMKTDANVYEWNCFDVAYSVLHSTATFFINGEAVGTASAAPLGNASADADEPRPSGLRIGCSLVSDTRLGGRYRPVPLFGDIFDVRIYSSCLDAASIASHLGRNCDLYKTDVVVSSWKCAEGSGPCIFDTADPKLGRGGLIGDAWEWVDALHEVEISNGRDKSFVPPIKMTATGVFEAFFDRQFTGQCTKRQGSKNAKKESTNIQFADPMPCVELDGSSEELLMESQLTSIVCSHLLLRIASYQQIDSSPTLRSLSSLISLQCKEFLSISAIGELIEFALLLKASNSTGRDQKIKHMIVPLFQFLTASISIASTKSADFSKAVEKHAQSLITLLQHMIVQDISSSSARTCLISIIPFVGENAESLFLKYLLLCRCRSHIDSALWVSLSSLEWRLFQCCNDIDLGEINILLGLFKSFLSRFPDEQIVHLLDEFVEKYCNIDKIKAMFPTERKIMCPSVFSVDKITREVVCGDQPRQYSSLIYPKVGSSIDIVSPCRVSGVVVHCFHYPENSILLRLPTRKLMRCKIWNYEESKLHSDDSTLVSYKLNWCIASPAVETVSMPSSLPFRLRYDVKEVRALVHDSANARITLQDVYRDLVENCPIEHLVAHSLNHTCMSWPPEKFLNVYESVYKASTASNLGKVVGRDRYDMDTIGKLLIIEALSNNRQARSDGSSLQKFMKTFHYVLSLPRDEIVPDKRGSAKVPSDEQLNSLLCSTAMKVTIHGDSRNVVWDWLSGDMKLTEDMANSIVSSNTAPSNPVLRKPIGFIAGDCGYAISGDHGERLVRLTPPTEDSPSNLMKTNAEIHRNTGVYSWDVEVVDLPSSAKALVGVTKASENQQSSGSYLFTRTNTVYIDGNVSLGERGISFDSGSVISFTLDSISGMLSVNCANADGETSRIEDLDVSNLFPLSPAVSLSGIQQFVSIRWGGAKQSEDSKSEPVNIPASKPSTVGKKMNPPRLPNIPGIICKPLLDYAVFYVRYIRDIVSSLQNFEEAREIFFFDSNLTLYITFAHLMGSLIKRQYVLLEGGDQIGLCKLILELMQQLASYLHLIRQHSYIGIIASSKENELSMCNQLMVLLATLLQRIICEMLCGVSLCYSGCDEVEYMVLNLNNLTPRLTNSMWNTASSLPNELIQDAENADIVLDKGSFLAALKWSSATLFSHGIGDFVDRKALKFVIIDSIDNGVGSELCKWVSSFDQSPGAIKNLGGSGVQNTANRVYVALLLHSGALQVFETRLVELYGAASAEAIQLYVSSHSSPPEYLMLAWKYGQIIKKNIVFSMQKKAEAKRNESLSIVNKKMEFLSMYKSKISDEVEVLGVMESCSKLIQQFIDTSPLSLPAIQFIITSATQFAIDRKCAINAICSAFRASPHMSFRLVLLNGLSDPLRFCRSIEKPDSLQVSSLCIDKCWPYDDQDTSCVDSRWKHWCICGSSIEGATEDSRDSLRHSFEALIQVLIFYSRECTGSTFQSLLLRKIISDFLCLAVGRRDLRLIHKLDLLGCYIERFKSLDEHCDIWSRSFALLVIQISALNIGGVLESSDLSDWENILIPAFDAVFTTVLKLLSVACELSLSNCGILCDLTRALLCSSGVSAVCKLFMSSPERVSILIEIASKSSLTTQQRALRTLGNVMTVVPPCSTSDLDSSFGFFDKNRASLYRDTSVDFPTLIMRSLIEIAFPHVFSMRYMKNNVDQFPKKLQAPAMWARLNPAVPQPQKFYESSERLSSSKLYDRSSCLSEVFTLFRNLISYESKWRTNIYRIIHDAFDACLENTSKNRSPDDSRLELYGLLEICLGIIGGDFTSIFPGCIADGSGDISDDYLSAFGTRAVSIDSPHDLESGINRDSFLETHYTDFDVIFSITETLDSCTSLSLPHRLTHFVVLERGGGFTPVSSPLAPLKLRDRLPVRRLNSFDFSLIRKLVAIFCEFKNADDFFFHADWTGTTTVECEEQKEEYKSSEEKMENPVRLSIEVDGSSGNAESRSDVAAYSINMFLLSCTGKALSSVMSNKAVCDFFINDLIPNDSVFVKNIFKILFEESCKASSQQGVFGFEFLAQSQGAYLDVLKYLDFVKSEISSSTPITSDTSPIKLESIQSPQVSSSRERDSNNSDANPMHSSEFDSSPSNLSSIAGAPPFSIHRDVTLGSQETETPARPASRGARGGRGSQGRGGLREQGRTPLVTRAQRFDPDPSSVAMFVEMGFAEETCIRALRIARGDVDAAIGIIMSGDAEMLDEALNREPGERDMFDGDYSLQDDLNDLNASVFGSYESNCDTVGEEAWSPLEAHGTPAEQSATLPNWNSVSTPEENKADSSVMFSITNNLFGFESISDKSERCCIYHAGDIVGNVLDTAFMDNEVWYQFAFPDSNGTASVWVKGEKAGAEFITNRPSECHRLNQNENERRVSQEINCEYKVMDGCEAPITIFKDSGEIQFLRKGDVVFVSEEIYRSDKLIEFVVTKPCSGRIRKFPFTLERCSSSNSELLSSPSVSSCRADEAPGSVGIGMLTRLRISKPQVSPFENPSRILDEHIADLQGKKDLMEFIQLESTLRSHDSSVLETSAPLSFEIASWIVDAKKMRKKDKFEHVFSSFLKNMDNVVVLSARSVLLSLFSRLVRFEVSSPPYPALDFIVRSSNDGNPNLLAYFIEFLNLNLFRGSSAAHEYLASSIAEILSIDDRFRSLENFLGASVTRLMETSLELKSAMVNSLLALLACSIKRIVDDQKTALASAYDSSISSSGKASLPYLSIARWCSSILLSDSTFAQNSTVVRVLEVWVLALRTIIIELKLEGFVVLSKILAAARSKFCSIDNKDPLRDNVLSFLRVAIDLVPINRLKAMAARRLLIEEENDPKCSNLLSALLDLISEYELVKHLIPDVLFVEPSRNEVSVLAFEEEESNISMVLDHPPPDTCSFTMEFWLFRYDGVRKTNEVAIENDSPKVDNQCRVPESYDVSSVAALASDDSRPLAMPSLGSRSATWTYGATSTASPLHPRALGILSESDESLSNLNLDLDVEPSHLPSLRRSVSENNEPEFHRPRKSTNDKPPSRNVSLNRIADLMASMTSPVPAIRPPTNNLNSQNVVSHAESTETKDFVPAEYLICSRSSFVRLQHGGAIKNVSTPDPDQYIDFVADEALCMSYGTENEHSERHLDVVVEKNKWVLLSLSYDHQDRTLKVYVDGELRDTAINCHLDNIFGGFIGYKSDVRTHKSIDEAKMKHVSLFGEFAELRIWSVAKTQKEIQRDMTMDVSGFRDLISLVRIDTSGPRKEISLLDSEGLYACCAHKNCSIKTVDFPICFKKVAAENLFLHMDEELGEGIYSDALGVSVGLRTYTGVFRPSAAVASEELDDSVWCKILPNEAVHYKSTVFNLLSSRINEAITVNFKYVPDATASTLSKNIYGYLEFCCSGCRIKLVGALTDTEEKHIHIISFTAYSQDVIIGPPEEMDWFSSLSFSGQTNSKNLSLSGSFSVSVRSERKEAPLAPGSFRPDSSQLKVIGSSLVRKRESLGALNPSLSLYVRSSKIQVGSADELKNMECEIFSTESTEPTGSQGLVTFELSPFDESNSEIEFPIFYDEVDLLTAHNSVMEKMKTLRQPNSSRAADAMAPCVFSDDFTYGVTKNTGVYRISFILRVSVSSNLTFGVCSAEALRSTPKIANHEQSWCYVAPGRLVHGDASVSCEKTSSADIFDIEIDTFGIGMISFFRNGELIHRYLGINEYSFMTKGSDASIFSGLRPFCLLKKKKDFVAVFQSHKSTPTPRGFKCEIERLFSKDDFFGRKLLVGKLFDGLLFGRGLCMYHNANGYLRPCWWKGEQHGIQLWIVTTSAVPVSDRSSKAAVDEEDFGLGIFDEAAPIKSAKKPPISPELALVQNCEIIQIHAYLYDRGVCIRELSPEEASPFVHEFEQDLAGEPSLNESILLPGTLHIESREPESPSKQGDQAEFKFRVVYNAATIRNGIEIDSSEAVGTLHKGDVVEAFESARSSDGVVRYRIANGWISERLRGGNEELVVQLLERNPKHPLLYKIIMAGGARARDNISLKSKELGMIPADTVVEVSKCVYLESEDSSENCVRLRISAPNEWKDAWISEREHIVVMLGEKPKGESEIEIDRRVRIRASRRFLRESRDNLANRIITESACEIEIPFRASSDTFFLLNNSSSSQQESLGYTLDDDLTTVKSNGRSRTMVLGSRGFKRGVHYWEVKVNSTQWGGVFIGVAPKNATGWSGYGFINYRAVQSFGSETIYGSYYNDGDTVGVLLDMDHGRLSFFKDGIDFHSGVSFVANLGVAYRHLRSSRRSLMPTLYPCLGFKSSRDEVSILMSRHISTTGLSMSTRFQDVIRSRQFMSQWHQSYHNPHVLKSIDQSSMYAAYKNFRQPNVAVVESRAGIHGTVSTLEADLFEAGGDASSIINIHIGQRLVTPYGDGKIIGSRVGEVWFIVPGKSPLAWYWLTEQFSLLVNSGLISRVEPPADESMTDESLDTPLSIQTSLLTDRSGSVSHEASVMDCLSEEEFLECLLGKLSEGGSWTHEEDAAIVQLVNEVSDHLDIDPMRVSFEVLEGYRRGARSADGSPRALHSRDHIDATPSITTGPICLQKRSSSSIQARFSALRVLSKAASINIPLTDTRPVISGTRTYTSHDVEFLTTTLAPFKLISFYGARPCLMYAVSGCISSELKDVIFSRTKLRFWTSMLDESTAFTHPPADEYDRPDEIQEITINRIGALASRARKDIDPFDKLFSKSVFGQLMDNMSGWSDDAFRRSYVHMNNAGQARAFFVSFKGEGVDDHSGPYRAVFEIAVGEEMTQLLEILVPSPNAISGIGNQRDITVFNPKHDDKQELLVGLGKLIGLASRHKINVPLNLPNFYWKSLTGDLLVPSDIDEVDSMFSSLHRTMSAGLYTSELEEDSSATADLLVQLLSSSRLEVSRDNADLTLRCIGASGRVAPEDLNQSVISRIFSLVEQRRLTCHNYALQDVSEGMKKSIPVDKFPLFTSQELSNVICGKPDVDISLLRRFTNYSDSVTAEDKHVQFFWEALEQMSPEELPRFINFCSGRSRLPHNASETDWLVITSPPPQSEQKPDDYLPVAQTCFFVLSLPKYSSAEVCLEKLRYAIQNAHFMDADFVMRSGAGWEGLH